MINNLTPKQLDDIHYFFNYFSGRKTTFEEELKQAETVDLSQRLSSDSAPNQHLLMRAYCEYSRQFTGHGFLSNARDHHQWNYTLVACSPAGSGRSQF